MKVMRDDTVKVRYEYLPDGTKLSALTGSGAGYKYRGSFVYSADSQGNELLESIAYNEGRISVVFNSSGAASFRDEGHVKDHLGNVRAVLFLTPSELPPSALLLERNDYLPFGTRQNQPD